MKQFETFYSKIENPENRNKFKNLMDDIHNTFPQLKAEIKWNQPMFILNDTFIIGFSVSKNHFSVAPEHKTIIDFAAQIKEQNYIISKSNLLFNIKWTDTINFELIKRLIEHNIKIKANCKTFWLSN